MRNRAAPIRAFLRKMMPGLVGLLCLPLAEGLAGGAISYEEIRSRFPGDTELFVGLEGVYTFVDAAYTDVRVLSAAGGRELGGDVFTERQFNVYYACARERRGQRRAMLVLLSTELFFFDRFGNRMFDDRDATTFQEKLTGLNLIPVKKDGEVTYRFDCSDVYDLIP